MVEATLVSFTHLPGSRGVRGEPRSGSESWFSLTGAITAHLILRGGPTSPPIDLRWLARAVPVRPKDPRPPRLRRCRALPRLPDRPLWTLAGLPLQVPLGRAHRRGWRSSRIAVARMRRVRLARPSPPARARQRFLHRGDPEPA